MQSRFARVPLPRSLTGCDAERHLVPIGAQWLSVTASLGRLVLPSIGDERLGLVRSAPTAPPVSYKTANGCDHPRLSDRVMSRDDRMVRPTRGRVGAAPPSTKAAAWRPLSSAWLVRQTRCVAGGPSVVTGHKFFR